ncbi:hypothetical protein J3A83DRAFT_4374782 [Scleroderma citrinum]
MAATAAISLPCPLRRSSRLAHAHAHATHAHSSPSPLRHLKHHHHHRPRPRSPPPDPEPDPDSSSSDPENELTPRALRALKRQRLAIDPDGIPLAPRPRPRKKRKENIAHGPLDTNKDPPQHSKRPLSPPTPLAPIRPRVTDSDNASHRLGPSITEHSMDISNDPAPSILMSSNDEQPPSATYPGPLLCDAFVDEPSILMSSDDSDSAPSTSVHPKANHASLPPASSISTYPLSSSPASSPLHPSSAISSPESEPLTPLTPLTPSPSPSPGHDRPTLLSPSPHTESLSPPMPIDVSSSSDTTLNLPTSTSHHQSMSVEPTPSSSHPSTLSLASALENLIPFDPFPPPFDPGMSLQLDAHPNDAHGSQPQPHAAAPQLQEHYPHTLPHTPQQLPHQLQYLPPQPPPILPRDREVNIWKLACQERVDYILRRYGVETIKAVVASEARCVAPDASVSRPDSPSPPPASPSTQSSQTRFRLYTPASYTWDSGSGSGSGFTSKTRLLDDPDQDAEGETEGVETDMDVEMDMDVDMEDDDEDYEDDDELGECDADGERDTELDTDTDAHVLGENTKVVDGKGEIMMVMDVDCRGQLQGEVVDQADKENNASMPVQTPSHPPLPTSLLDPSGKLPSTSGEILAVSIPPAFALPLRPQLPPLSSLHVPLLSEPPRAFMGRGTPPDRRRLVEWSISGHYPRCQTEGFGVGLYLSTTHMQETGSQQRSAGDESVGIVALSVPLMHPTDSVHEHGHHLQGENCQQQQSHQHGGEWTSLLYAMLEGNGMDVCHTGVGIPPGAGSSGPTPGNAAGVGVSTVTETNHASDAAGWYELGLSAVHMNNVVSGVSGDMPLSHHHSVVHVSPMDHAGDDASSSTLRFALG